MVEAPSLVATPVRPANDAKAREVHEVAGDRLSGIVKQKKIRPGGCRAPQGRKGLGYEIVTHEKEDRRSLGIDEGGKAGQVAVANEGGREQLGQIQADAEEEELKKEDGPNG